MTAGTVATAAAPHVRRSQAFTPTPINSVMAENSLGLLGMVDDPG